MFIDHDVRNIAVGDPIPLSPLSGVLSAGDADWPVHKPVQRALSERPAIGRQPTVAIGTITGALVK